MQMDERNNEIREGAGLDESRVNQEFIDMLSKWSTPALFVIAAVVLGYWGWGQLQKRANAKVNEAFDEVAGSVDYTVINPSPNTLNAIRAQHGGVAGVVPMTSLREADVYLEAAVKGVAPGSELALDEENNQTGTYSAEDLLGAEERTDMLDKAEALYRAVATSAEGGDGWAIHRLSAQFGLAAVAESRGDSAAAKVAYEDAKSTAEVAGFSLWIQIADERIASVDQMVIPVSLVSREALPKDPEPEVQEATEDAPLEEAADAATDSTTGETPDESGDDAEAETEVPTEGDG
jgi:hypothetical protein